MDYRHHDHVCLTSLGKQAKICHSLINATCIYPSKYSIQKGINCQKQRKNVHEAMCRKCQKKTNKINLPKYLGMC